jgi:adenosylcobinamide-GDP ribazoletransferase
MSIKDCLKGIVLNIQFLTRIPIPVRIEWDDRAFAAGAVFAPIIGLLVGLFSCGVYLLFGLMNYRALAVFMGMTAEIVISGGLHLDGMADTFDALFSYRDPERMLAIMKDSRLGTNGAIGLFTVLILKYLLLFSMPDTYLVPCFLAMPVLSRMTITWCAGLSPYARKGEKSAASALVEYTGLLEAVFATVLAALIAAFFLRLAAIPITMIVIAFVLLVNLYMKNKIGGITGDIIGGVIELSELLFLFTVLFLDKINQIQKIINL